MTMKRGGKVIVLVSPPSECELNAIVVRNEVLLCSVINHVTLTFDLETCRHSCRGVSNPSSSVATSNQ